MKSVRQLRTWIDVVLRMDEATRYTTKQLDSGPRNRTNES